MRNLLVVLLLSLFSSLYAQTIPNVPAEKPKLVVVLVIDQMRFDLLSKYKNDFGPNGFNRLLAEGSFCVNARHEYMLTQQLPGYATIVTGAFPSTHGIVSDSWFTRLNNQEVNAGVDRNVTGIGTTKNNSNFSPRDLQIPTLTDELVLASQNRSKIHSIAIDGRAAAIAGGFAAQGVWWFDIFSGNWVTSSYYRNQLPAWLEDFNGKKLPEIYVDRKWTPRKPQPQDSTEISLLQRFFKKITFVYDLLDFRRISQSYRILTQTPMGISLTFDMAKQVIVNESLGKDDYPDFLMVGINPTGAIMRKYGPLSIEVEDTYLRLDEDLGYFIQFLDMEIGLKDVLLVLTSDRGASHDPKFLQDYKLPAGIFDSKPLETLATSYLNAIYGKGNWILGYRNKQFYLNHTLIEDAKLSLPEVQDRLVRFVLQFSGISGAQSASTLQSTSFNQGIFAMMQRSFNQRRSGDVIINFEPGWIEKSDNVVDANSGYDYDTHVPLIWYGWRIPRTTIYKNISTTSIAATLAAFLDIVPPGGSSGEVILELMQKGR